MKIVQNFVLAIIAISFIWSCTKPPDYPDEPTLTFKSLSRNTLVQGTIDDTLLLVMEFTDGDGDIISEDTIKSIFFTDKRDGSQFKTFALPQIPEPGRNNGISGEITMIVFEKLGFCCIFSNGLPACQPSEEFPVDTLIYQIQMEDQKGNLSNVIETDPIFILCQ